ncbi:MAG: DUF5317 family protein [Acidimicrobiales bacterium]
MAFIALAIVVGLVAGVLAGGRVTNLGRVPLRGWPLLLAGAGTQAVAAAASGQLAFGLVVASYALLVAFAGANLAVAGMGLVLIGIVLNLVPIAANASMPVRESAVVAAGLADWREVATLGFTGKRHLERPGDRFTLLGDIIPFAAAREVLSFGDVVLSFGAGAVVANMARRRRRVMGAGAGT